jgi:very-short-patch-repair endonuclease
MDIGKIINEQGGIARTASLRQRGATSTMIRQAIATGAVMRVHRGWYATARAPRAVITAVQCGGRVSCVTALSLQGVWMIQHPAVHVCIARHGQKRSRPNTVVHWMDSAAGQRYPMDGVCASLEQLARCRPLIEVIVAADSVLNRKLASQADVVAALSTSGIGRRALALIDGASDSGIETLARVPLVRRGIRVQTQVMIPGVGHVDILIGDRLVLELDGEEWHSSENFETDRERDAQLVTAGYLVIRASYRQVVDHWPELEQRILMLIRRREHLWRAGDEQRGHQPRSYRRSKRSVG